MIIDLRTMSEPLADEIRKQIQIFTEQHPEVKVCTVALGGDGFHGHVAVGLDTEEHSAAFVAKYPNEQPLLGNDAFGVFCNNPWDFAYSLNEIYFPGYPDLYEMKDGEVIDYLMLNGTLVRAEENRGDEAKHIIIQEFLASVIVSLHPFAELNKTTPFRYGVCMVDGGSEFWTIDENDIIVAISKQGVNSLTGN